MSRILSSIETSPRVGRKIASSLRSLILNERKKKENINISLSEVARRSRRNRDGARTISDLSIVNVRIYFLKVYKSERETEKRARKRGREWQVRSERKSVKECAKESKTE